MNNELLSIISYLERDRGVNREIIIQAIESAIQQAARKSLDVSNDLRVEIDRKTLSIKAFDTVVVSDEDSGVGFLALRRARTLKRDVKPGDTLDIEIPPSHLGRIAAQTARQMILQKIREAERKNVYDEYKDRIGDIVSGTIRQIIHRDLIVELGKTEAIMPAKERIPTEEYNVGDRIRAYVFRVQSGVNGPAVVLSRACSDFVKTLFRLEVSEIADGIVEVMGVARDPGYRSKIAVKTLDEKVDPVGACVGLRGVRVRNIVRELNGEKIDIVRWSEDIKQYVAQSLAPAKLEGVTIDPDESRTVHVMVAPDQLSLAIGKRGQNVRLSSKLTGWRINIQKSGEEVSFEEQRETAVKELAEVLDISEETASTLVANGFLTTDGIIDAEIPYLQEVTGLDEETVRKIWTAAQGANGVDEAGE
ncbi:MAG: transcription termination factor NusA [Kiritimatiellia bacterium]|nr:transcription termination factor NusA [Kiritimatiellia bacterium]MDD4173249.1 transcription termination factor NusA [Kiritimatiellia bacterium]MDD4441645.1 transcription termination factor NusA [Kiritimatiellia bacterium]MDX9793051.1 transcription termination factor NusA [Kiritimatiellia bacterium]NLC81502.1 transcription termination factor NusA [Lentisphaerota bacterium]